jgi:hypothetical protein
MGPADCREERHLWGHSPNASRALMGHGHRHHDGVFPACPEAPGAFTAPALGLPTEVLDHCGLVVPSPWQRLAAFCGHPCRCSVGETETGLTSECFALMGRQQAARAVGSAPA